MWTFPSRLPPMLKFIPVTTQPSKEDHCLIFAGRDAIVSLQRPPEIFWRRDEVIAQFGECLDEVALGVWEGRPCYAMQVDRDRADPLQHIQGNLYTLLGRVPDDVFAAYGRAIQLLGWRRDHQFCGRCGTPTMPGDGGRALVCRSCGHSCYPRLSPCVIVAVTRGDELLLAAAPGRQTRFYSTLAGFVEPGESAEHAVAREVHEEVGVEVTNIRYFGSQPWPFPGQLMLGFFADYAGGDLVLDPQEIEDAGWFKRDNLPPTPPATSIAGQLIRAFFDQKP